jgi:Glycosyltransferase
MSINMKKKLLILKGGSQYVTPDLYNIQEIGLGKALSKHGWEVLIISSGLKLYRKQINEQVEWVELKRIGKRMGWPKGALGEIIGFRPDVIQLQDITNTATFQAVIAKIMNKVPLVLSLGEYKSKSRLTYCVTKVFSLIAKPFVDAVLCKTQASIDYSKQLGFSNNKYAPVGIDESVYIDDHEEKFEWENKLKVAKQNGLRILCHIGRLDKQENIPFLLKILRELPDRYILLLVGEPVSYVEKIMDKELQSRVILAGRIPNKYVGIALKLSDLYMACSKYEIFGMSAAESVYHGLPVLGFATGGIKEIIQNDKNGWLMAHRDAKEWSRAIKEIFKEEETNLVEKKNYCSETGKQLTWNYRSNRYNETYAQVIQSKK